MLQLESTRFGTATLATQLESIQFGTATLATQLQSIRFRVHTLTWKASDLVPLFCHRNLKASALLSLFCAQHRSIQFGTATFASQIHTNSRPLYFWLESIQFGTATFATHLHSIRFGTTTFSPHFKASDLVPLLWQHTFAASDLAPDIFQNNTASRYVFILPTWPFLLQKNAFSQLPHSEVSLVYPSHFQIDSFRSFPFGLKYHHLPGLPRRKAWAATSPLVSIKCVFFPIFYLKQLGNILASGQDSRRHQNGFNSWLTDLHCTARWSDIGAELALRCRLASWQLQARSGIGHLQASITRCFSRWLVDRMRALCAHWFLGYQVESRGKLHQIHSSSGMAALTSWATEQPSQIRICPRCCFFHMQIISCFTVFNSWI